MMIFFIIIIVFFIAWKSLNPTLLPPKCPLCLSDSTQAYHRDRKRDYWHCQRCKLVYVSPELLPSYVQEKAEYDLHQNNFDDPGYRQFLQRAFEPLRQKLVSSDKGLDFGCGPTPVLAAMFQDAGFETSFYDPIYFPDPNLLNHQYDFITCTEAIEHFHQPRKEWLLLQQLLKPGGWLVVMTKRVIDQQKFATWHYKNDPTHVIFFSCETFNWLAQQYQMQVEFPTNDVVVLRKGAAANN